MPEENLEQKIEVVIPSHNDYVFLPNLIENSLLPFNEITGIHIIDNASSKEVQRKLKDIACTYDRVNYHYCEDKGKGNAIKYGINVTSNDCLFMDADLQNFTSDYVSPFIEGLNEGYGMVKANFVRSNGQSNSSFISDKLTEIYPELDIKTPTSGIYSVSRDILDQLHVPTDWSVDLSILIQSYELGYKIKPIDIGYIQDKARSEDSLQESKHDLNKEIDKIRGYNYVGNIRTKY